MQYIDIIKFIVLYLIPPCGVIFVFAWKIISNVADKESTEIYPIEQCNISKEVEEKEAELAQREQILKVKEMKLEKQEKFFKFEKEAQEKIFNEKYEEFPWAKSFYENFIAGLWKARENYFNEEQQIKNIIALLNQQKNELIKQKELQKKSFEEQKKLQDKIFEEKTIGFPWAAEYYKNLFLKINEEYEYFLAFKNNPAPKSAKLVSEHSQKAAEATRKMLIYQAQLAYYESLFPWLTDFKEAPDEAIKISDNTVKDEHEKDPATQFLSSGEWETLSKTEKFQKSLERYWKRHKSKWEIGRDFERFIGYEYEMAGYDVTYFGAIKGFEDMGRDLIAKKRGKTEIVQCKYWAKDKVIHEKHIFQLFGTCITYSINLKRKNKQCSLLDNERIVDGVFITSCTLSETAKKVADILKIKYIENKRMTEWPSIKCNIGKDGEKIYHLPFDQQYDKIKISKKHNEFYAMTIDEAESAGFRRAFRWHGNNS